MEGFLLGIAAVIYFLPMLIGYAQDRKDAGGIAAINILLGWTLAGWIIALVKACSAPKPTARKDAYKAQRTSVQ